VLTALYIINIANFFKVVKEEGKFFYMFFWGKKGLKLRLSLVKIGNIALTLKKFE